MVTIKLFSKFLFDAICVHLKVIVQLFIHLLKQMEKYTLTFHTLYPTWGERWLVTRSATSSHLVAAGRQFLLRKRASISCNEYLNISLARISNNFKPLSCRYGAIENNNATCIKYLYVPIYNCGPHYRVICNTIRF